MKLKGTVLCKRIDLLFPQKISKNEEDFVKSIFHRIPRKGNVVYRCKFELVLPRQNRIYLDVFDLQVIKVALSMLKRALVRFCELTQLFCD